MVVYVCEVCDEEEHTDIGIGMFFHTCTLCLAKKKNKNNKRLKDA